MSAQITDSVVSCWCLMSVQGKLSFIKELAGGLLPTRTEQEMRDHEAWYQQYLQLNDRKKEVIQRWREKKEVF